MSYNRIFTPSSWLAVSAFLAGCATEAPPPALDVRLIGGVIGEIKHQVGIYQSKVQSERDKDKLVPSGVDSDRLCGNGKVDFNITSVNAELTTKVDINTNGSASITAPVAPGVTLGPTGGAGKDAANSQILTFTEYPSYPLKFTYNDATDRIDDPKNVVAATLYSFRTAIRNSAYVYPCFSTVKK